MQHWTKSSYSGAEEANCVECRTHESRVLVRDTQNRTLGHLAFPGTEWAAFLQAVRVDKLER